MKIMFVVKDSEIVDLKYFDGDIIISQNYAKFDDIVIRNDSNSYLITNIRSMTNLEKFKKEYDYIIFQ